MVTELVGLRSRHAKHFDTGTPGQRIARITAGPQHFRRPDGAWEDIANLIQQSGGDFIAETQDVRWGLEGGYLTASRQGRSLTMRPTALWMVDRANPATRRLKLADASYANVVRDGQRLKVTDIFPNTDLYVVLSDVEMRKRFVVRQKPNLPDPAGMGWDPATTFLAIAWEINLPAGVTVHDTVTDEAVGPGYAGTNGLTLKTAGGTEVLWFQPGQMWGSTEERRLHPVWYVSFNAAVPFAECFPYQRAASQVYPLNIDPSTTITSDASADDGYINAIDGTPQAFTSTGNLQVTTYTSKGHFHVYRAVLDFDLSSLSGYTCDSASLKAYCETAANGQDTCTAKLYNSNPMPWATGDYDSAATAQGSADLTTTGWKTWTLTAANLEAKFGANASFRIEPGPSDASPIEWANLRSFDYTGTSFDPYLDITYTVPTSSVTADAVLKATGQSGSWLADSILLVGRQSSSLLDAVLEAAQIGSVTSDATIQAPRSDSATADAIQLRTRIFGSW